MVKYVLIISQYHYSYIQKICKVQDDFIDQARNMVKELEDYKRFSFEKETRSIHYGDLDEKYNKRTKLVLEKGGRLNINDAGDIYFELSDSIEHLVNEVIRYKEKYEEIHRYDVKDKMIEKNVLDHHDRLIITGVIKKYFEVI